MKNPKHQPLNWKGKLFVCYCIGIVPMLFISWPVAFVMMLLAMKLGEIDLMKPISYYKIDFEPKQNTVWYWLAHIGAPQFYIKKPFRLDSWRFDNPLYNFDSIQYFYHSRTGSNRDPKLSSAFYNFIETYAQNQLGKSGVEFTEQMGKKPDRFNQLRSWAYNNYRIWFTEIMIEGTVLLESPDTKEMIAAEKLLQDAVIAAHKFPSRAKNEMISWYHASLEDLRDRPRYETTWIEHYIEISYYDYPGLTKKQIREKFIEDWA